MQDNDSLPAGFPLPGLFLSMWMWRQNTTTALSSCPGGLENILLTRDSPEDFNPNLLLYNEQPGPDSQVLDLEYLPYYRTSHLCVCPAPHIYTEREKSSNESKANTKQDKKSILPSLELSKRTISPTSKEKPPAQELLGASSSALHLPVPSFPSRLPHLKQPPPCSGYFPYYRTEGGICTGPLQRTESFTGIEGLETKGGGQRGGSSIWNLRDSCLVS
ncbi:uncharacterized protein LOC128814975 isoform X1 [Vidua macroura]|uniref:uncharacterized protein LOC128814975 isoform X1 n=1 Tax=Vidua macroura TaxID=187451 RepID=UPI0023A7C34B|nr:uncharacterized protein LOC128814975 isoform X1 [Vidua macroura]